MKQAMRSIGILLGVVGVVGFVAGTELKKTYRVHESSGASDFAVRVEVVPPHTYRAAFTIVAEKGESQPGFATARAEVSIRLGDETLTEKTLSASSSESRGGLKRATIGTEATAEPRTPGLLSVEGALLEGDRWDLEIYRDMPTAVNLAPGLAIVLGLVGLVLFLRARAG